MNGPAETGEGRTRREYLRYGAAVVAAGGLAGCAGGSSGMAAPTNVSHSVAIEPVGEVEFESVPETWMANNGSWADMGIALGLEPPKGVWLPDRYHTHYYDEIPGVSVDGGEIRQLWGDSGVGKEQFYEMDADVHVFDPNFLLNRGEWRQSDLDEIRNRIGPIFGNSIFSRTYGWHDDYRYYTLYEAFEKLAQVFRRTDRYEGFEGIHEEFQDELAAIVPGDDRPAVAVVWADGDEPDTFYPYVVSEGTSFKHLRDLEVDDALANTDVKDFHGNRGAIDYETLLEVDPEVLLVRGQEMKTRSEFRDTAVAFMEEHTVGRELTAVSNGDVYRAGPLYQGPITNLIVTERLAGDLYGVDEELFDRGRVADVVDGEF